MRRFRTATAWYNYRLGRYDYHDGAFSAAEGIDYVPQTDEAMRLYVSLIVNRVSPVVAVLAVRERIGVTDDPQRSPIGSHQEVAERLLEVD